MTYPDSDDHYLSDSEAAEEATNDALLDTNGGSAASGLDRQKAQDLLGWRQDDARWCLSLLGHIGVEREAAADRRGDRELERALYIQTDWAKGTTAFSVEAAQFWAKIHPRDSGYWFAGGANPKTTTRLERLLIHMSFGGPSLHPVLLALWPRWKANAQKLPKEHVHRWIWWLCRGHHDQFSAELLHRFLEIGGRADRSFPTVFRSRGQDGKTKRNGEASIDAYTIVEQTTAADALLERYADYSGILQSVDGQPCAFPALMQTISPADEAAGLNPWIGAWKEQCPQTWWDIPLRTPKPPRADPANKTSMTIRNLYVDGECRGQMPIQDYTEHMLIALVEAGADLHHSCRTRLIAQTTLTRFLHQAGAPDTDNDDDHMRWTADEGKRWTQAIQGILGRSIPIGQAEHLDASWVWMAADVYRTARENNTDYALCGVVDDQHVRTKWDGPWVDEGWRVDAGTDNDLDGFIRRILQCGVPWPFLVPRSIHALDSRATQRQIQRWLDHTGTTEDDPNRTLLPLGRLYDVPTAWEAGLDRVLDAMPLADVLQALWAAWMAQRPQDFWVPLRANDLLVLSRNGNASDEPPTKDLVDLLTSMLQRLDKHHKFVQAVWLEEEEERRKKEAVRVGRETPDTIAWTLYTENDYTEYMKIAEKRDQDTLKEWIGTLKKQGGAHGGQRRLAKASSALDILGELRRDFPHFAEILDRIDDHLALARVGSGAFSLPPLLLAGPPGTGKTFFFSRLADALKIPYKIVNMESINGSFALVGSESQWGNSAPGLIFETLITKNIANPIILLDEVDKIEKMSGYGGGAIESVLLPLLESHTAACFTDRFMQIPLDIRPVIWVATANDLDRVSAPVRSRFEVIHVRNPNEPARQAMARAMYTTLRTKNEWGAFFRSEPPEDVIEHLARPANSARNIRKNMATMFATAARNDHERPQVTDCPDDGRQPDLDPWDLPLPHEPVPHEAPARAERSNISRSVPLEEVPA